MSAPTYVELHARSAFSFLRGASFPEQLGERAAQLGLPALALCDRDGLYGAPRFHQKAKEAREEANVEKRWSLRTIVGCELTMECGGVLPVLVATRPGYRNLCSLISRTKLRAGSEEGMHSLPQRKQRGQRAAENGEENEAQPFHLLPRLPASFGVRRPCPVDRALVRKAGTPVRWSELAEFGEGLIALTGDEEGPLQRCLARDDRHGAAAVLERLCAAFGTANVQVEIQRHLQRGEEVINAQLVEIAHARSLPLLATNGVLYAMPRQRAVLDVFTCARKHTHLDAAGRLLSANDERYLKSAPQMRKLFPDLREAVENSVRIAERLEFSLENLGYEFPDFPITTGETTAGMLRRVTLEGARKRYGKLNREVRKQLAKELDLIIELGFAGYFLIVWDLVNFCRESDIMVQGRGSAANSAVCYSLGITACDPIAYRLLFERFLAEGRTSWPDIDLDLPSGERRERVIQEVYRRYGPNGAAMTANVIPLRGKSCMREIGKALNFAPDVLGRFSALFANGDFPETLDLVSQLERAGVPRSHPRAPVAAALYGAMYGLPRHLGQHSGGMIICRDHLSSFVPLENASMPGRVVAQWDKDDCEDLGIIKVDLLGLGMMSALQDAFAMRAARGEKIELHGIPQDDPATYDLLQRADTVGLFQVESRAQMATLPRLKPVCFYDLVVEVAIVRPGPIQGGLMHPYLKRRNENGEPDCIHPLLRDTLARTKGVPLFQEQMLRMAMIMADFTGAESEELRRALSFHRSHERMEKACAKLRQRMTEKGHPPDVIEKVVGSTQSFAVYGFPESHAISFAYLAYASAWLKVHCTPEFYASLLNNQPMGFYSSATLVADGKRRGVRFRPVSVLESEEVCTIEGDEAIRLGFCIVNGLQRAHGSRIVEARREAQFASLADFQERVKISRAELRTLARIGALNGLAAHRRDALWRIEEPLTRDELALARAGDETPLAPMDAGERTRADFAGTDLTLGQHPMALLRPRLPDAWQAKQLPQAANGTFLQIAGAVICRQRPGTAKGFVFVSLEDETGVANAVLTPRFFERNRLLVSQEPYLVIEGVLQNHEGVIHIRAQNIRPLPHEHETVLASHDFR